MVTTTSLAECCCQCREEPEPQRCDDWIKRGHGNEKHDKGEDYTPASYGEFTFLIATHPVLRFIQSAPSHTFESDMRRFLQGSGARERCPQPALWNCEGSTRQSAMAAGRLWRRKPCRRRRRRGREAPAGRGSRRACRGAGVAGRPGGQGSRGPRAGGAAGRRPCLRPCRQRSRSQRKTESSACVAVSSGPYRA